jgi:bacteriorhodopsin
MANYNTRANWIWIVVVIIVLLTIIWWGAFISQLRLSPTPPEATQPETTPQPQ